MPYQNYGWKHLAEMEQVLGDEAAVNRGSNQK